MAGSYPVLELSDTHLLDTSGLSTRIQKLMASGRYSGAPYCEPEGLPHSLLADFIQEIRPFFDIEENYGSEIEKYSPGVAAHILKRKLEENQHLPRGVVISIPYAVANFWPGKSVFEFESPEDVFMVDETMDKATEEIHTLIGLLFQDDEWMGTVYCVSDVARLMGKKGLTKEEAIKIYFKEICGLTSQFVPYAIEAAFEMFPPTNWEMEKLSHETAVLSDSDIPPEYRKIITVPQPSIKVPVPVFEREPEVAVAAVSF